MRLPSSRALLIAYAAVGIATFGHSAAAHQKADDAEYAACQATPHSVCFHEDAEAPAGALMAAMLWPLYWSWEAFS